MAFSRSKIPALKKRRDTYRLLADWYGEERAETEIAAHTSKPRVLGEVLKEVSSELLSPDAADFAKLETQWEAVAGKTVAKLTKVVGCVDHVVILGVRHSAMVTELRPSLDLLKNRINQVLGKDFCREVRLTVM
ncbi:MAG: DUF721 domain-containing protein [Victivallaceae bacterium]|nr:DUF721 domain-containing protein [Victivallaceae bacterium]